MEQRQIPVPALKEALTPPGDGTDIKISLVDLTPGDAEQILEFMSFDRQRNFNRGHAGNMAHAMTIGHFIEGSMITFSPDFNNQPVLTDGQHRLSAAVMAQWAGRWTVRALWGEPNNARDTYVRLDTSQKERTQAAIGKARAYDHITPMMQNVMVATARYQNRWSLSYHTPPTCNLPPPDHNIQRVEEQMKAFETIDAALKNPKVRSHTKRRICSPMVLAVIIETTHAMPEEAPEFWEQVATDAAGIPGHLRELLIQGRPSHITSPHYAPRIAAMAWNQRDSDNLRLTHQKALKIDHTDLEIPE